MNVVQFFDEKLGPRWLADRPNLARRLETPTKTILRGEHYYSNMANLPPLDRLSSQLGYLGSILDACNLDDLFQGWPSLVEWKLTLAVCDQIRNLALQLSWFSYKLNRSSQLSAFCPGEKVAEVVGRLADAATALYYSTLLMSRQNAPQTIEEIRRARQDGDPLLKQSIEAIRNFGESQGDMAFTQELVRRWREADHPGENLLVAVQAIDFLRRRSAVDNVVAIGVGWGGIELPLVLRHVWNIMGVLGSEPPLPLAAHYSHYRSDDLTGSLPYNVLTTGASADPCPGSKVVLFDDNVLTGQTLERVHDDLLRRACEVLAVFLTRVTGGRRYGQMRMEDHGVVNHSLIGEFILGFLGETAFSLAWSREAKKYANPIGVFSLPRRRILELLHANSSVERYEREGF